MKVSQGGRGYDSDILLKSRIMANELFCLLYLILRLSEARVSMTNAKGARLKEFKTSGLNTIPQSID